MPLRPNLRPLVAILVAALVAVAWSSELETIELDGYRATFDPDQPRPSGHPPPRPIMAPCASATSSRSPA